MTPVNPPSNSDSYSLFELRAGPRLEIGNPLQAEAAVSLRPMRGLAVELAGQSNFSSRFSATLGAGLRFRLSDTVSLQPTTYVGVGSFSDYPIRAGRLLEDVNLNGLFWRVGVDPVRLLIQPPDSSIQLMASLGVMFEGRGEATPNVQRLISGEDPHGSNPVVPALSLTVVWGVVRRGTSQGEPVAPLPESVPAPVSATIPVSLPVFPPLPSVPTVPPLTTSPAPIAPVVAPPPTSPTARPAGATMTPLSPPGSPASQASPGTSPQPPPQRPPATPPARPAAPSRGSADAGVPPPPAGTGRPMLAPE